jgi:hypothetical protein
MELRQHPGMAYRGVPNWPPVWLHAKSNGHLNGELGFLKYVHASNGVSNKCYLVMEYERTPYVGCLIFENAAFCYQVARLLRQYQGRSIEEIGGLKVDHLL